MGGTVVRASVGSSSTICIVICPRLLRFQRRLVARSSSSIAPQFIIPVLSHPASLARISPLHSRSLPTRQSSVASLFPSLSFDSSSASLMSSRGAPALSSLLGTRLERLSPSGIRQRLENSLTGASCVKLSADIWSIAQSRNWCRREGPSVGIMSAAMENKGRRIDCYSSSQAGGGDQPTVASVLPPIPPVPKAKGLTISFCPRCGGATEEKIPVGEHELRFVCTACGAVHYQNPKMVVGCLVEHEEKVLLCRRNIEPSYGLWTLPAGYMEIGESAAEGAARETLEEACADVQVVGLFAHLDIPFIGQSYIIFRAQLKDLHFAPGPESLECALFKLDEIPFESLAFSSIYVALKMYVEDIKAGKVKVHHGVIQKRPGASPSDLQGFVVRDVLSS